MCYIREMVYVRELRWNPGVVAHVAQHDVTLDEVEEVRLGDPMSADAYAGRVMVIGPTNSGRMLAVIISHVDNDMYDVITARPASRKERRRYLQRRDAGERP